MNENVKKYGLIVLKALLAILFAAAGVAKLIGVPMMVENFDMIGLGQWFRYVTGIIELGSAILLFVPGRQAYGAVLLVCTMIGAVLAHLVILGPSAVPAFVLGVLCVVVLYAHREQLPVGRA